MNRCMTDNDSETYRGYTIRVVNDCDPMNPHEWDCTTPMLIDHGRGGERDYSHKDDLRDPFAYITPWQCSRHFGKLCQIIDIDPAQADSDCRDYAESYCSLSDARHDYLREALQDISNRADLYAALAELWRFAGCAAIDSSIHGFSQGDYADVLAVQTPQWREMVGAPALGKRDRQAERRDLKSDVKTYEAYAFGNCYGFVIEDSDGQEIDSCFGFYGMDVDESGLWEAATDAIDSKIESRRKARQKQLKRWIVNRVPLYIRQTESA